jgi:hypothetical protein
MKVIIKLYCPICGKEMCADCHAVEDGAKWRDPPGIPDWSRDSKKAREIDNWICLDHPEHKHCVVFDRDDIKDWLEEGYKEESGL